MEVDYFSQSKIKTWRRCQKSYDYKYNQSLVRRANPVALLRGTTLHAMLEAQIKGTDPQVALEEYRKVYDELWGEQAEGYPEPEELQSIITRYNKHWADDGLDYGGRAEIDLVVEYQGMKFRGIIDALPDDRQGRRWLDDHKCLDSEHWVHTNQGMTQMKDLTLDHKVVSSDGHPIGIQEIVHQVLPGFEIELKGNKKFRATAEHRWPALIGTRPGRLEYKIVDTQSLLSYPVAYLVPSPPIKGLNDQDYLIDPYVLGALIGDGCLAQSVRFCCPESEILGNVASRLPGHSIKRVSSLDKADSYYLGGLRRKVKSLGLLGKRSYEKHIPPEYLLGSHSQRWDLLSGLMDTDGTVYKNSSYLYVTTSPQLAWDIQVLIQSLGGVTLVRSPKSNKYQGGKEGRKSYSIKFTLPPEYSPPFKLSRKILSVTQKNRVRFGSNLRVMSVKPLGDIPVTDITVNSEDHLFSCEGVLTHNTHKVLPDEDARFSDIQTVLYYWAMRERGDKVDGILWDYIRTKPPTAPEVLKNGTLSKRKNIDCDSDTYLAAIIKNGLNRDDYSDMLALTAKNTFFKRVFLPNPAEELITNVVEDFFISAREILQHDGKKFCRNMTKDCKMCTYYSVCSAEIRGVDSEFIKKQIFTIRKD